MSMWQGCLHFQGTKWRQVISLTKISCWRIERCVLRNCLASTCSLQRAWTEPPVPFGWRIYQGLSGCKMKMDLWVSCANYKSNCCTVQMYETFWGIHYAYWKWSHTDPTSQSTFWFLSNFWKTKYFAEHLLMPPSCSKLSVCQTIKLRVSSCRGHCLLSLTSFKRSASYLSLIKRYPKDI